MQTTRSQVMLPKQIEIEFLVVNDRIWDNTIELEHTKCTKKMPLDPLTKGLPPKALSEHVVDMGLSKSM